MLALLVLVAGVVVGVYYQDRIKPKVVAVVNAIKTAVKG